MRTSLGISTLVLLAALNLGAQGRGHAGGGGQSPSPVIGGIHSNAPANSPAATPDRDFGKNRAEDAGQGRKKGLNTHSSKTANKGVKASAGAHTK